LHLDDPNGAELILLESAQSLGAGKEVQKTFILGDLAIALIRQGNPEQATAVLHQAIDTVELRWSGGGMQRVLMAGRELFPWLSESFVTDLQDRLLAVMIGGKRDG
jgi:hypothetical protein